MVVELDLMEQKIRQFLQSKPFYVRSSSSCEELVVSEIATCSRSEVLKLEHAMKTLLEKGLVVLGVPESDDPTYDQKMSWGSTRLVRKVYWVEPS